MSFHLILRRAVVLTLAALLSISTGVMASLAQQGASSPLQAATRPSPYKRLEGPTHPRPPRTYDALHYTIRTRFDVPQRTVFGDETLTLKPLAAGFKSFDLDAASMKIDSVTLASDGQKLVWTQTPDKLSINLDRAYAPAETINVRIQYRANPQRGLYFITRTQAVDGVRKPAQIWTQGEPEENHHWFPCYDFPDDKATSEQYITTGAGEVAISNGALLDATDNPDGTRTFHWQMAQPHATYLISMVVGSYAKLTDAYKNIPVEYYTYPGTEQTARRAFARTPEMMQWFSSALRYEYPYNKYAQTVVSYFIFGGMENITATTHADWEILRSDAATHSATQDLIAHELAHSWFGNLVTCKDWSHAWLNEGLATFMEASFREHAQGRAGYLEAMRENASLYYAEDKLRYRRPLVYERYRTPIDLFDATLYKKGALVMHMLREVVGDQMFWKALNRYLNENRFETVETADLERAFEETTGKKLDWFFEQWVYKAGYPEVRVRYVYNAATRQLTLYVAQTQTPDTTTPAVFRLPVDVELTTAAGTRTEHLEIRRREEQFTFKLESKPVSVSFDKNSRLLMKLDFPQSQEMRPALAASLALQPR
ncbi:MAG TPA: DUF3458 domain-containing protein [Pyrinomonadaceae bacterium]